jgi:hypothetical protein
MSDKKETKEGAMDDQVGGKGGRSERAREAQKKAIEAAGDTDSPVDANSAAWNRGRLRADPSRKKTTKQIKTT